MHPSHHLGPMKATLAVLTTSLLLCTSCGDSAAPVLLEPDERIIGRSGDDAQVRLLTTSHRLLVVDVRGRSRLPTMRQTAIALESGDEPWGLATSPDGRLWTLIGTNRLVKIDEHGRIAERVSTKAHYIGLFSVANTVLVQSATPAAGRPALQSLDLRTMLTRPAGSLRSVQFATRLDTLTRNLVACGSTRGSELPCWFAQGLDVDKVSTRGDSRQQRLRGVGIRSPDPDAVRLEEMSGPIIDAHIDVLGRLWVLVRRSNGQHQPEYVVARYSALDELQHVLAAPDTSRLILTVRGSDCLLLTGNGQFATITAS